MDEHEGLRLRRGEQHPVSEAETRNKNASRRLFEEVWNKGNVALIKDLVAPDHVSHDPNNPNQAPGPEGVRQLVSLYRGAFPDLHFKLEDVIAEGDRVVTRVSATGTHERDLPGIPATGRRAEISGFVIARYEDGKVVEDWVSFDFLALFQQLGVIPKITEVPAGSSG